MAQVREGEGASAAVKRMWRWSLVCGLLAAAAGVAGLSTLSQLLRHHGTEALPVRPGADVRPPDPQPEDLLTVDMNRSGLMVGEARHRETGQLRALVLRHGERLPIDGLDDRESFASGVNDAGMIAGSAHTAQGRWHAFRHVPGRALQDLGTLGGAGSIALDINSDGHVVGYSSRDDGRSHAFLARDGAMQDLGTLGGKMSHAAAVSDAGHIVGQAELADGARRAFLIPPGGAMLDLGTLGGNASLATGVNARGQVVGAALTAERRWHAFLYENGRMTDLGHLLPSGDSFATSINRDGAVAGVLRRSQEVSFIFVYEQGRMRLWSRSASMFSSPRLTDQGLLVGASYSQSRFAPAARPVDAMDDVEHGSGAALILFACTLAGGLAGAGASLLRRVREDAATAEVS
jgi:probable HAF family extracellular repeat protein